MLTGGTLFEELGFYYVGPIDGHNLDHLLPVLQQRARCRDRPDPGSCRDAEGQGLRARRSRPPTSIMASSNSTSSTGRQSKAKANAPSYTKVFGESLVKEAQKDDKIVAITAAMPSRHRRRHFRARRFRSAPSMSALPSSTRVTFAAGLATEGYKPFVAIYSTFLQRAYDQVVHDVAIQSCRSASCSTAPVWSAPTARPMRARSTSPISVACRHFVLMAAADEAELVHMVATQAALDDAPVGAALSARRRCGRRYAGSRRSAGNRQGPDRCAKAARSRCSRYGTRLPECMKAAEALAAHGLTDDGGGRPLCQAARCRSGAASRARTTKC